MEKKEKKEKKEKASSKKIHPKEQKHDNDKDVEKSIKVK